MKQMEYRVRIEPVPDTAAKGKVDIDSTTINDMLDVKLVDYTHSSQVPKEKLNGYQHKIDLMFLFGMNTNDIDCLDSFALQTLFEQRYAQRFRVKVNRFINTMSFASDAGEVRLGCHKFCKFTNARDMDSLFKTITTHIEKSSAFEDLDTKRFLLNAMHLVRAVAHRLKACTEHAGSKKFRAQFDEIVRSDPEFKQTPWLRQVKT